MKTLGVDMGGTKICAALMENNQIARKNMIPCPSDGSQEDVINALYKIIQDTKDAKTEAIGIGVPSVVDTKKGIVYNVANIPSWKKVELKDILENHFKIPVWLENDSNCFSLGVAKLGEGKKFRNFVGMTIGTGIGAGIIIDKHLYGGGNDGAGEIGSLAYKDADYESYCASRFFTSKYGKSGKEFNILARQGNRDAINAWHEFGYHFGNLMKACLYTYDPEAIILGGSISKAFDLYKEDMWKQMSTFPYPNTVEKIVVEPSVMEDAPVLGAALLCNT